MTMRKYLVTIHEDGHMTAQEFEEPADIKNRYKEGLLGGMSFLSYMADERIHELSQKAKSAAFTGCKDEAKILTAQCEELESFVLSVTREVIRVDGARR